jgi:hypothetical protein
MKSITVITIFLMSSISMAASNYDCSSSNEDGSSMSFSMEVVAGKMNVTVDGEIKACEIDESAQSLTAVNDGFLANLGLAFDAELVVTCPAPVADEVTMFLVSKKNINDTEMNTVVSNPVVGPIATAKCTKK